MRKELLRRELGRMMRALQDSRDKFAETPALNFPEAKILERSWCATGQAHEQAAPWAQPSLRGAQMTAPTATTAPTVLALPCQPRCMRRTRKKSLKWLRVVERQPRLAANPARLSLMGVGVFASRPTMLLLLMCVQAHRLVQTPQLLAVAMQMTLVETVSPAENPCLAPA